MADRTPSQSSKASALTYVAVSFGSTIELGDDFDIESTGKLAPDLGTESVTKHKFDLVLLVIRRRWLTQQVSANFTNVLSSLQRGLKSIFINLMSICIVVHHSLFSLKKVLGCSSQESKKDVK